MLITNNSKKDKDKTLRWILWLRDNQNQNGVQQEKTLERKNLQTKVKNQKTLVKALENSFLLLSSV